MGINYNRIELPDGDWADIRNPRKVSWGRRKPIRKASVVLARQRSERMEQIETEKAAAAAEANPGILGAQPLTVEPVVPEKIVNPEDPDGELIDNPDFVAKGEEDFIPSADELGMVEDVQEAATIALVAAWSFDDLPISVEGLQDLPADAADILIDHCSGLVDQLFTNTEATTKSDSPTKP